MKTEISVATEDELIFIEKAREELMALLANSEVPPYIWISVFSFITINSVDREKMSYDEFVQATMEMFNRYRGDWK